MPEVVIKYKKPETLRIIKSLAKYLDFVVADNKGKRNVKESVTIIPGDKDINIDELSQIFTANNAEALQLRKEAWQRK